MKPAPIFAPSADEAAMREEVRAFARSNIPADARPGLGMNSDWRPDFSAVLADRGWIGMGLPPEYGGSGLGAVERFVVVEELLAAGAPLGAHWFADRQTAALIAKFGSDYLKRHFLPEIAGGRCFFSVGLSEPDSGSDLASVRTTAARITGGWQISGSKIWTSGAHVNHYATVLLRTGPIGHDRHAGLSQIIVDLHSPGVSVSPIATMDGEHHFSHVTFDEVFAPDEMLLGHEGQGWAQVTSELVSERAGPDRYMSVLLLLQLMLTGMPEVLGRHAARFGSLVARLTTLRRMSQSVAAMIDEGMDPGVQVPLIKDLGTTFEQEVVAFLREIVPGPLRLDHHEDTWQELLTRAVLTAPTFTLRGGTNQILRNLIARQLT